MDVAREDGAAVPALRDAPLAGVALPAREDDVEDVEAEREVEAEDVDVGVAVRVVVAEPLVRTLLVIVCGVAVVAREVEVLVEVVFVLVEGVAVGGEGNEREARGEAVDAVGKVGSVRHCGNDEDDDESEKDVSPKQKNKTWDKIKSAFKK